MTAHFEGLGKGREHIGFDAAGPTVGARTPVYAVADGTVTIASGIRNALPGHSGNVVEIDHGILTNAAGSDRIWTNYGHLSKIIVTKGQKVKAGQQIGVTGNTGQVTGVHLHFGVKENGRGYEDYFDGYKWLKSKGITVGQTPPLKQPVITVVASKIKVAMTQPTKQIPSDAIKKRQTILKRMDLYKGPVDGYNSTAYKTAIKGFQSAHGLVADGGWGTKTQARYVANLRFQNALKKMAGVPNSWDSDGFIGRTTLKWRDYVIERQGWTLSNLLANLKKVGAY